MKHFSSIYKFLGSTFLSICLIFLVLNIVISKFDLFSKSDNYATFLNNELIQFEAYLDNKNTITTDSNYINEVIKDFSDYMKFGDYQYYPNVEYVKTKFKSKHLNIINSESDIPHRLVTKLNAIDSNTKSIYCFGGSTTYGSLVSDNHTWPSFLSSHLKGKNVIVKNYGCEAYSPTSETRLFLELIRLGHRPSLVIFMDGVNTGPIYDASEYTKPLYYSVKKQLSVSEKLIQLVQELPIVRLFIEKDFKQTFQERKEFLDPADSFPEKNYLLINRFLQNVEIRNLIAQQYNIQVLHFLQPNTLKSYNYSFFRGMPKKMFAESNGNIQKSYEEIYTNILNRKFNNGYIDLSHLFESYKIPAVVDILHYSPSFNNYLASEVNKYIDLNQLKPHEFSNDLATGTSIHFVE